MAEIAFEDLPDGATVLETFRALRSFAGVLKILLDPSARRVSILFDPAKVNLAPILSALEPLGPKPRVILLPIPIRKEGGILRGRECFLDRNGYYGIDLVTEAAPFS